MSNTGQMKRSCGEIMWEHIKGKDITEYEARHPVTAGWCHAMQFVTKKYCTSFVQRIIVKKEQKLKNKSVSTQQQAQNKK